MIVSAKVCSIADLCEYIGLSGLACLCRLKGWRIQQISMGNVQLFVFNCYFILELILLTDFNYSFQFWPTVNCQLLERYFPLALEAEIYTSYGMCNITMYNITNVPYLRSC